jgi:SWIM zinc finger
MTLLSILKEADPTRYQRAVQGLRGRSITVTIARHTKQEIRAIVKNGDGREYRCVLADDHAVCSCGDSFYRGSTCKHCLAVVVSLLQQNETGGNLIHLQWDDGHILCGEVNPRRFWQRWTWNAVRWSDVCPTRVHTWMHPTAAVAEGGR